MSTSTFPLRMLVIVFVLLFSCTGFGQTRPFRFAWLSDTHVGSATGAADLESSVHDINTMESVSFVVISGDITEMGFDAQLEQAKTILDSLKRPYYIIPGNHDTKWSPSGCTTFTSLWGKDRFVFEYGGFRFIGMHEGPIMKMGDGHFPPEDIRWLDSVLTALPDKSQPVFFITHYPLDPGLDNWYAATERFKHYNTQAVLVGHEHQNRTATFEGLSGVVARSNLRGGNRTSGFTIVNVSQDSVTFTERTPGGSFRSPWHSLALGQRTFSRDTVSYDRPEFSVNTLYKEVRPLWTVSTGYTIASTPAVFDDYAVVGNSSGAVLCYSILNGSKLWSFRTGSTVYSSPAVSQGKVVIGSSDRTIYCLDIKTGRLVWQVKTGAAIVAAPVIDGGIVYLGASDGVFRAIDLSSGAIRWEYRNVSGFVETRPLLYDGKVIFGAWDTYLYALNTKDGSLAWKWSNGNAGILYSPAACWPVASHGKVFIVAPDRFMTAIDAETGKTIWRSKRYQVRECVGISQDGQRIYARCMVDTVVAFSSATSLQSPEWESACGYGYDIDPSMPVEKDNQVMFGTKNGLVYGLDAKSGKTLWIHRIGVTVVNTPAVVDNHHVLVTDLDGSMTLLEHTP